MTMAKKQQAISDKTVVGANGYCYSYRNHIILITPGFCGFHGEITFNNELVDSGFCGYGLKTCIERINRRIDRDIADNG